MNKKLMLIVLLAVSQVVLAGGIVTNSNQSVQFVRMLSRNASTDIDATYFNPAGLTQLPNGWHFAVYNQTIFQEKKVTNTFPTLNNNEFIGDVKAPIFPNLYAVYKKDKLALSFGFGPNGGGGSADFANGLPSFETAVSVLPAMIPSLFNVTGYQSEINFSGSSVYLGFQLNASYALSDMFSVALGGRYIYALNAYEGAIKNIKVNPKFGTSFDGSYILAYDFFTTLGKKEEAALVTDKLVDVKQTGSAMTPILGLNVTPMKKLNIAVKYEFNTNLELQNETTADSTGLFPDGYKFRADIPAILTLGAQYAFTPSLRTQFSYSYYFDKNANWEGAEKLVDNNFYEWALGLEYDFNDAWTASIGYLRSVTGVSADYQSDIDHSLSAKTLGGGVAWKLNPALALDFGFLYTMYDTFEKDLVDENFGPYTETYDRKTVVYAVGLGYSF